MLVQGVVVETGSAVSVVDGFASFGFLGTAIFRCFGLRLVTEPSSRVPVSFAFWTTSSLIRSILLSRRCLFARVSTWRELAYRVFDILSIPLSRSLSEIKPSSTFPVYAWVVWFCWRFFWRSDRLTWLYTFCGLVWLYWGVWDCWTNGATVRETGLKRIKGWPLGPSLPVSVRSTDA